MKILFFKSELGWPRVSGHDVHAFHLMRELEALGHRVSLVTRVEPLSAAFEGLRLANHAALEHRAHSRGTAGVAVSLSWLQRRFCSYWGIEPATIEVLAAEVSRFDADAFVAVGLDALPYLAAAPAACRVWYAADEWFLHHASLVRVLEPASWGSLKRGMVKLIYERAFSPLVHRAWVVSEQDRRAMRLLAGMKDVDVVPNGVDPLYFAPHDVPVTPRSAVFWGRLDFEPNIQAMGWFCRSIWPAVKRQVPDAKLEIFGFNPVSQVRALAQLPGVRVTADLPDLRAAVVRQAIAVLPFVTGAGIKNKLLEAASLGMPILCTHRACSGLKGSNFPFVISDSSRTWVRELVSLWSDEARLGELGSRAREWVTSNHTWGAAARDAAAGLQRSLALRDTQTLAHH